MVSKKDFRKNKVKTIEMSMKLIFACTSRNEEKQYELQECDETKINLVKKKYLKDMNLCQTYELSNLIKKSHAFKNDLKCHV